MKNWKYNKKTGLYNKEWKYKTDLFGVLWEGVKLSVYENVKTGEYKIREENPFCIPDPWELDEKTFKNETELDDFIDAETGHLEIKYGNANAVICIMNAISAEEYEFDTWEGERRQKSTLYM